MCCVCVCCRLCRSLMIIVDSGVWCSHHMPIQFRRHEYCCIFFFLTFHMMNFRLFFFLLLFPYLFFFHSTTVPLWHWFAARAILRHAHVRSENSCHSIVQCICFVLGTIGTRCSNSFFTRFIFHLFYVCFFVFHSSSFFFLLFVMHTFVLFSVVNVRSDRLFSWDEK